MAFTRFCIVVLGALAISCGGPQEPLPFLEALKRSDYDAAHAMLHPDARASVPNGAAIKARMDASRVHLDSFTYRCTLNDATKRFGYTDHSVRQGSTGKLDVPVVVGVPPAQLRKCNMNLVVDMKRDETVPGSPWKVVGMKME